MNKEKMVVQQLIERLDDIIKNLEKEGSFTIAAGVRAAKEQAYYLLDHNTVAPLKIVAEQLNMIGISNVLINTDSKIKNKIRCNINWEFAWHRDPINYPLNTNPNEDVKFGLSGVNFIIVSEPEPKKEHYPSDENTPNK